MKLSLLSLYFLLLLSCNESKSPKDESLNTEKTITTSTGLIYTILRPGTGPTANAGQEVLIHETMGYRDSLLFDSRKLPSPVKVLIGANQAIAGVDEGLRGMQKGEIRKLIVPPALSKRTGNHIFPHPDSILVYEIELMEILSEKIIDKS